MDACATCNTFVIDESRLSREGMVRLLDGTNFKVAGQSATITDFVAGDSRPDAVQLMLVNLETPTSELYETLATIKRQMADLRIVMIVSSVQPAGLIGCFNAGIDGCLMKDISTEALVRSLALVLTGERVYPSRLIPAVLKGTVSIGEPGSEAAISEAGLSEREIEILGCLVDGDSNKMIANRLDIAEATIKVHLKSILRKIKAQNRTQAAIWAINHGIAAHPVSAA